MAAHPRRPEVSERYVQLRIVSYMKLGNRFEGNPRAYQQCLLFLREINTVTSCPSRNRSVQRRKLAFLPHQSHTVCIRTELSCSSLGCWRPVGHRSTLDANGSAVYSWPSLPLVCKQVLHHCTRPTKTTGFSIKRLPLSLSLI